MTGAGTVARGRFVAFEGGEGSGKSTQARLLAQALQDRGIACVATREPGGTPGAEALRKLLLDKQHDWSARAEALLFAAARADHVEKCIGPALDAGKWVICDRYVDSSRAYQGGAGGLTDTDILALHSIGSGGLLPDCTVLIVTDPAIAATRARDRDGGESDRIGARNARFHDAVAASFLRFAEREPQRFCVVPGDDSAGEVHARVIQALIPWIGKA